MTDDATVVAVDVGGTSMKGAAFDSSGRMLARETVPSFHVGGEALPTLTALIDRLIGSRPRAGVSVGIASPGVVDSQTGTVRSAANLGWHALPLAAHLEAVLGVGVTVDHDARAAARAELSAQNDVRGESRDFVFIPIGTGVSASVVAGGVVIEGATGSAGEIGHLVIAPDGDFCGCGQRGCLETVASAPGIARRYRANGGEANRTSRDVAAALDDDPIAQLTWSEAVDALSVAIRALVAVTDPALIVIGGGVGAAGDRLIVPLRASVARHMTWRPLPGLEAGLLGAEAGLMGAALIPDGTGPDFARTVRRSLEDGRARDLDSRDPETR